MTQLTEAEAAVYDRQLRVWGVETQKRCGALLNFACRDKRPVNGI